MGRQAGGRTCTHSHRPARLSHLCPPPSPPPSPPPPQLALVTALALVGSAAAVAVASTPTPTPVKFTSGKFSAKLAALEAASNKTGAVKAEAMEMVENKLNHTMKMADKVCAWLGGGGGEGRGRRGHGDASPTPPRLFFLSLSFSLSHTHVASTPFRVQVFEFKNITDKALKCVLGGRLCQRRGGEASKASFQKASSHA